MLDFEELRSYVAAREVEWDAARVMTLAHRGNELAGEVGEACNVIKKLERTRLGVRGKPATVADLADELADVIICTFLTANHAGIDLAVAVVRKFNETSDLYRLTVKIPDKL